MSAIITIDIPKLVNEAVDLKEAAADPLWDVPSHLRPGRECIRNQAAQKYQETLKAIREGLTQATGAIIVTGPRAALFAEAAKKDGPAIVINAAEVYERIAKVWHPTVRVDKTFALDCVPALIGGLTEVIRPLAIVHFPNPEFGAFFGTHIETLDEATALTRNIIRATVGDDLNAIYLPYVLAEKVVEEMWDLKFIPVCVTNSTQEELKSGLFDRLFSVNVGCMTSETLDNPKDLDDAVLQTFKTLRGARTKSRKTETKSE